MDVNGLADKNDLLAEWTRAGKKEKPRFGLNVEKMKSMAEAGSQ